MAKLRILRIRLPQPGKRRVWTKSPGKTTARSLRSGFVRRAKRG